MYKEIKQIETRIGVNLTNHGLFLLLKDGEEREIVQMDINGNESDKYDFIDLSELYRLHFMRDHLIISFENGTTSFYTYDKKKICEINEQLSTICTQEDEGFIYMENKEVVYRFDKRLHTIEHFRIESNTYIYLCAFSNNLVFRLKGGQVALYKNTPSNISLSWQLDLRTIYSDIEDFRIYEIKEYQGSIIVATRAGVVRLSAKDGSIIWETCHYAPSIEIVENIGYVCTGAALYKINLDTGEESGYGWGEYDRLPDFTYHGKVYWASGSGVVYHDGLLWHSVHSSGYSFLIAINPENGNYEWIHKVDTYENTDEPQFYGDAMFLRDTGNILHIYRRTTADDEVNYQQNRTKLEELYQANTSLFQFFSETIDKEMHYFLADKQIEDATITLVENSIPILTKLKEEMAQLDIDALPISLTGKHQISLMVKDVKEDMKLESVKTMADKFFKLLKKTQGGKAYKSKEYKKIAETIQAIRAGKHWGIEFTYSAIYLLLWKNEEILELEASFWEFTDEQDIRLKQLGMISMPQRSRGDGECCYFKDYTHVPVSQIISDIQVIFEEVCVEDILAGEIVVDPEL